MIVCVCYTVSDRRIKELIEQGARTYASVRNACDAGRGCGACVRFVKDLVDQKTGLLPKETCGTSTPRIDQAKEYPYGQSFESAGNCRVIE